jgi:hypothetical protein
MSFDRSFVEQNRAATARIAALADRLTDEDFQQAVGEHWTVSMALAHLAFWDRRVLLMIEESERAGKLTVVNMHDLVNDLCLPFWAAIPARQAAQLAIDAAQAVDQRLAACSSPLLEELHAYSERWVLRAVHRNTHLDEVEAALVVRGA